MKFPCPRLKNEAALLTVRLPGMGIKFGAPGYGRGKAHPLPPIVGVNNSIPCDSTASILPSTTGWMIKVGDVVGVVATNGEVEGGGLSHVGTSDNSGIAPSAM